MMRVGHVKIWQNSIPGQLSSRCKGPEVRCAWRAGESKRGPKVQSEGRQGEEDEVRETS